jgi:hypothetical protein
MPPAPSKKRGDSLSVRSLFRNAEIQEILDLILLGCGRRQVIVYDLIRAVKANFRE